MTKIQKSASSKASKAAPSKSTAARNLQPISASIQRFLVPLQPDLPPQKPSTSASVKGKKRAASSDSEDEGDLVDGKHDDLWVDRFEPEDEVTLAVHNRKLEDVRRWLKEALDDDRLSQYRRVLVLSGPSGSGKTATLRVLSKELEFDILEYRNSHAGTGSLIEEFPSFLSRAGALKSLDLVGSDDTDRGPAQKKVKPSTSDRRVILVEDLPNIFTSPPTRASFRLSLTSFATSRRPSHVRTPLIVIVSESISHASVESEFAPGLAGGGRSWESNVSSRTVVPLEILNGGRCSEIKFNPIANTIMTRALKSLVEKVGTGPNSPRQATVKEIEAIVQVSNGDIRSAINCLQLSLCHGVHLFNAKSSAKPVARSRGRKAAESSLKPGTHIAGREASLFLFHALGKVLYSKRWGENEKEDAKDTRQRPPEPTPLAAHLKPFKRQPSKVDVNILFADAPVDSEMFRSYLHQNYTQFTHSVEECWEATEAFSQADSLMRLEGDSSFRHPLTSSYSFQLAVRSILLALPSPVPRRGQKLFKASMWDLQRLQRENEQALCEIISCIPTIYTTRQIIAQDIIPLIPLLPSTFREGLPRHCYRVVEDLARFPKVTSAELDVLDEGNLGDDQEQREAGLHEEVGGRVEESAKESNIDERVEKLYLSDDDIEEFD